MPRKKVTSNGTGSNEVVIKETNPVSMVGGMTPAKPKPPAKKKAAPAPKSTPERDLMAATILSGLSRGSVLNYDGSKLVSLAVRLTDMLREELDK